MRFLTTLVLLPPLFLAVVVMETMLLMRDLLRRARRKPGVPYPFGVRYEVLGRYVRGVTWP
jgi:hypothetical protein